MAKWLLVLILFFWVSPSHAMEILRPQPGELTVTAQQLVDQLGLTPLHILGQNYLILEGNGQRAVIREFPLSKLPLPTMTLPAFGEILHSISLPLHRSLALFGGTHSWQGHRLIISKEKASRPATTKGRRSLAQTKARIQALLADEPGTYGVHLLDLKTMQTIGIRENHVFFAASTIKVPLNLYLYDLFSQGKVDLAQTLTQQARHQEGGTGVLQHRKPGGQYTLRELARLSIRHSDNVATNMLLERLGRPNFLQYLAAQGGKVLPRTRNITTPLDMTNYLLALLNLQQRAPHAAAPLLLDMENNLHRNRIPRYLPKTVLVANKIGTWDRAVHDVGIIFHHTNPYILCVYSQDVDPERGEEVIAKISQLVYQDQGLR